MTDRQRNMVMNAIKLGGVFVTCGEGEKTNVMSTHWGTMGRMWNRDVFILPVRRKKLSNELITKGMSFVVNVPTLDMSSKLLRCDSMSGRTVDKMKELGLTSTPSKMVRTPGIAECGIRLECKVIYTCEMKEGHLDHIIARDMYINREYHTLFFGEIVRSTVSAPKK